MKIRFGRQLRRRVDDHRNVARPAYVGYDFQVSNIPWINSEREGRGARRDRRLDLPGLDAAHSGAGAAVVVADVDDARAGGAQRVRIARVMRARQDDLVGKTVGVRQRRHSCDVPARHGRCGGERERR